MNRFIWAGLSCLLAPLLGYGAAPTETPSPSPAVIPSNGAALRVIEKWHGTWKVSAHRRKPLPEANITYLETYDWVLNGRFLRSRTSERSEGSDNISMIWFDVFTQNYRFMIFDALGYALELPPPQWDEASQTMTWRSGFFAPVSYTGQVRFTDADTIHWTSHLKDWKGTVVLDLEGTSTRLRKP